LNEPEEDLKKFLKSPHYNKNKRENEIRKVICTPRKWELTDIGKKIARSEICPISHKPFSEVD